MGIRCCSPRVDDVAFAVAKAINDTRRALVSTNVHADTTPELTSGSYKNPTVTNAAISAANASDLATLVALCKDIRVIYALHIADSVAHKVADTVDVVAAAEPSNLATAITFLNECKTDYELHRASTTYHYTADATNTIVAADATDQATSQTLANELKTDINAHILAALGGHGVRIPGVH